MWEGPSWLASESPAIIGRSHQTVSLSSTQPSCEQYSPPTKWPRVTTPPSRRESLLSQADDSGLGLSFSSPPVNTKLTGGPSPLKTPSTRSFIHMAGTPSPYRFRNSSFSSPTITDRALRLSNTENVIGIRFCENSMGKMHQRVDITRLGIPQQPQLAARCLDMPTTSLAAVPERALPMYCDAPETPSKCFSMDESGLFDSSYPMMATSTPLKSFNSSGHRVPLDGWDISAMDDQYVTTPTSEEKKLFRPSPETPSSFKRAMEDVKRQGLGNLLPRKLIHGDDDTTKQNGNLHSMLGAMSHQDTRAGAPAPKRRRSSLDTDDSFQSPKRALKPFSRRWMKIVTGGTKAQRDVTSLASEFLKSQKERADLLGTPVSSTFY